MTVLTLPDRKHREAERRRAAAAVVIERLRSYAGAHGGRFTVFGSAARGEMRYDSDIDILLDFLAEARADAWDYAETVCAGVGLPADIQPMDLAGPRLLARIASERIDLA